MSQDKANAKDGANQDPSTQPSATAPTPDQETPAHPLDALTAGAFSAQTSGERAACLRQWLATNPAKDQLEEVARELTSLRDRSATRLVRERLEELRRTKDQDKIAGEWAARAEALLADEKTPLDQATAWQRDAAKAGAPLSREPLASLRQRLAERIKAAEELQHAVQVQREVAVLLTQRIEVLSTKPWMEAKQALSALGQDVQSWQDQAAQLLQSPGWLSVQERFAQMLPLAQEQLLAVWEAFNAALESTESAASDESAPLPAVPVWADEIRVLRGLPIEAKQGQHCTDAESSGTHAAHQAGKADKTEKSEKLEKLEDRQADKSEKSEKSEKLDLAQKQQTAQAAIEPVLESINAKISAADEELAQLAAQLRQTLRQHGRWLSAELAQKAHQALVAAGDATGWQPQLANEQRQVLIAQAQSLLERPQGQELSGRKLQEQLRLLRQQWREIDQNMIPNHALWRQFDAACSSIYAQVQTWLTALRQQTQQQKTQRLETLEQLKAWTSEHASTNTDWRSVQQILRDFTQRWRQAGHMSEKVFAELQPLWREAMQEAQAPLRAAQNANHEARQSLIAQAQALLEQPPSGAGSIVQSTKALQQKWQELAQAIPLERKIEQKLWQAFREPLDALFTRGAAARRPMASPQSASAPQHESPQDRQVLEAAKALQAANASGDAAQIQAAISALNAAKQAAQTVKNTNTAQTASATEQPSTEQSTEPSTPSEAPIVAVRGDDRPNLDAVSASSTKSAKSAKSTKPNRAAKGDKGDKSDKSDRWDRPARPAQAKLGHAAFRAQRQALESAEQTLRKLSAQAHGQAIEQLLSAWSQRSAEHLPTHQELGAKVSAAARSAWAKALEDAPSSADNNRNDNCNEQSLLRVEIAADVPSPASEHSARRMLQLQLLTQRNAAMPQETWVQDVATVLTQAHSQEKARRLQSALKNLMRK